MLIIRFLTKELRKIINARVATKQVLYSAVCLLLDPILTIPELYFVLFCFVLFVLFIIVFVCLLVFFTIIDVPCGQFRFI